MSGCAFPSRWTPWLAVLVACHTPIYLVVKVVRPATEPATVALQIQATLDGPNGASSESERVAVQAIPPNPADTFLIVAPLGTSSIAIAIQGEAADGGAALLSGRNAESDLRPGINDLEVDLLQPCATSRDCDLREVCEGSLACVDGGCAPQSLAATDGVPCGPFGICARSACSLPFCGDGLVEIDAGEACDEGASNGQLSDHCRSNCTLPYCGDGITDSDAGEKCDLGPQNGQGVGCNATCNLLGALSLLAGQASVFGATDGPTDVALFYQPWGIARLGRQIYVADSANNELRLLDLDTQTVSTLVGHPDAGATRALLDGGAAPIPYCYTQDGTGTAAGLCTPMALTPVSDGFLVGEQQAIRHVSTAGLVTTIAGQPNRSNTMVDGPVGSAAFNQIGSLVAMGNGQALLTAEWVPSRDAAYPTYNYGCPSNVSEILDAGIPIDGGVNAELYGLFLLSCCPEDAGPSFVSCQVGGYGVLRQLDLDAGVVTTFFAQQLPTQPTQLGKELDFETSLGLAALGPALYAGNWPLYEGLDNLPPLLSLAVPPPPTSSGAGFLLPDGGPKPQPLESATPLLSTTQTEAVGYTMGLCSDGRSIYLLAVRPPAIWQWDTDAGTFTPLISVLGAADAGLSRPMSCAYDAADHALDFTDVENHTIWEVQ